MENIAIYRKRLIPSECVLLKDDIILSRDADTIITSWKALHKRNDLSHGYSCYYLNRAIKLSRFIRHDGCGYWYIDIVDYSWSDDNSTLTVTDLLADVVVYPDGRIRVIDLNELADAFTAHLIDETLLKKSLYALDRLLHELYEHGIEHLGSPLKKYMTADPDAG